MGLHLRSGEAFALEDAEPNRHDIADGTPKARTCERYWLPSFFECGERHTPLVYCPFVDFYSLGRQDLGLNSPVWVNELLS